MAGKSVGHLYHASHSPANMFLTLQSFKKVHNVNTNIYACMSHISSNASKLAQLFIVIYLLVSSVCSFVASDAKYLRAASKEQQYSKRKELATASAAPLSWGCSM